MTSRTAGSQRAFAADEEIGDEAVAISESIVEDER